MSCAGAVGGGGGRSPGKLVAEVLAPYRDVGVRVGDFVGDVHGIDVVVR